MTPSSPRTWRENLKARGVLQRTFIVACLMLVFGLMSEAQAAVTVRIELARQRMNVDVDGVHYASWSVSTARRGYRTPAGTYTPYSLQRMHYSTLYDYTPMPYSIFFSRGYAIHGTYEVHSLGRPVSHGCIRLRPDNARILFRLIHAARDAEYVDRDPVD